ncbi:hypothetical protein ES703_93403 [subsurface metagenome]
MFKHISLYGAACPPAGRRYLRQKVDFFLKLPAHILAADGIPIVKDSATGGAALVGQHLQQARFPRSRLTDDGISDPAMYFEVRNRKDQFLFNMQVQVLDLENWLLHKTSYKVKC